MAEGAKPGFLGLAADSETPIEHLDYNYIGKCKNAKEIEKLLRILRSGKDGYYPELIEFTEKKLEQVNPRSKLLRKDILLKTYCDLDQSDGEKIKDDIKDWTAQMNRKDVQLKSERLETNSEYYHEGKNPLPPIRSATDINSATSEKKQSKKEDERKTKNVVPRNYRDWDRFDPDKELEDQEKKEKEAKEIGGQQAKPKLDKCIPEGLDHTVISQQEKEFRAAREKDKGNDAFRIGDFDESVVYYTRSISLQPTAAAFNNRAAAKIKLQKYQEAIDDCNKVLEMEPNNLKAFLRRGIAYKGTGQFDKSSKDLQQALNIEPSNKRAKEILSEISKIQEIQTKDTNDLSCANKPKKKGQRLKIVEVDGEEEDTNMPVEVNNVLNGKDMDTDSTVNGAKNLTKSTTNASIEKNELLTQSSSTNELHTQAINGSMASLASETNGSITPSIPLRTNVKTIAETSSNKNETVANGSDRLERPDNVMADGSQKVVCATKDTQPSPKPDNTQNCGTTELPLPGVAVKAKDEGLVLFKKGRFAEALEKYSKAIDILWKDKENYQMSLGLLLSNRAACHYKIGDCDGCIDDCNKALALTPAQTKLQCRRAAALETKEKYFEAYRDYQAVLLADPFNKTAQDGNSRIIRHLQSIHGPNWRQTIPATPSEANPTLEIPVAGSGVGILNIPEGKDTTTTTPTSSDQSKDATIKPLSDVERFGQLKEKGNTFVKKGKYSEAVDCYTQCIALCPGEVASYTNRALCYLKLSKPDLAESDSSEALKIQYNNVKALFRRALARKALKDYDQAAKDLFQLMKIEPKNTAGKKELDIVLELCREKRRMAQKQEADEKEKTSPKSEVKLQTDSKTRYEEKTTNQRNSQPIRRKRIQIQEVEADDEDAEEEKAPVSSAGNGPVSNGPVEATASPQANTDGVSLKHAKPEGSQNKKPSVQKQAQFPSMKKATAYEFVQAWNSVTKGNVAGYAAILAQVQPTALPKVLSNSLDADMLKSIVKALLQYLLPDGKADQCYKILKNLCHAQRFNMVLLFLAEKDKEDLNSLFSKLEASQSKKPFVDVKELKNLRKKYTL